MSLDKPFSAADGQIPTMVFAVSQAICRVLKSTVVIGLLSCAGCSPTAPTSANLAGSWSGTAASTSFGNGTFLLTLSESGSTASTGTWTLGYTNGSTPNKAGEATWSLNGSDVTLTLTSVAPVPSSCVYNATGSINSTSTTVSTKPTMSGKYQTVNCAVADSGTFTITRQ